MVLILLSTPLSRKLFCPLGADAVGREPAVGGIARARFRRHHAGRQPRQIGDVACAAPRGTSVTVCVFNAARICWVLSVCSTGADAATSTV